jgi:peptide/nickel transport system permease protein
MSTLDFAAELRAAGANVKNRWGALRFFVRRYPLGAIGAVIMAIFVIVALLALIEEQLLSGYLGAWLRALGVPTGWIGRFITPYDPLSTNAAFSLAKPSAAHWFGCDFMGRDLFSRIVYGARVSITVAVGSMLLGCSIGVTVGLLSGYLLGWFDLITQRVLEMMQSLPLLVMAIIMAAALGPSMHNTIIAIAIPLVPYVARVIRANTLSLREQPFVEAAKAIGMAETRIAIRHVLPNTLAPLIVLATAQIGSVILIEASLSFLGLGIPEPWPSWGRMLSESAAEYVRTAPLLVVFPGAAISLVVFGTNLLGDALRDMLDPRQRS